MINTTIAAIKDMWFDVSLNIGSGVIILADLGYDWFDRIPNWQTVLIVLSVVFLNVARGIAALRKKK